MGGISKMQNTISELELMDIMAGNLRSLMNEYGYNQKELAKESGISEASISRYLECRSMPTLKAIFNLCMVFECPIEDIIGSTYWVF